MPAFDLKGIKIAQYSYANSAVTYSDAQTIGDAMNVNLELRYAEGRLYAESKLAEYLRKAVGGTISIGEKYIPAAAQKVLFGAQDKSRTVGSNPGTAIAGLEFGSDDVAKYVGVAFYCPDMIDGVEKYTCVFVRKAMFAPPSMSYQTKGQEINFSTPTTTGEFLPDDTTGHVLIETATAESEANAQAWITAVLA